MYWFPVLLGGVVTALGTGITEVASRKMTRWHEALGVSLIGGAVTGITAYYLHGYTLKKKSGHSADKESRRISVGALVAAMVVSSLVSFTTSEAVSRETIPLHYRGILVGLASGTTYSLLKYLTNDE